MKWPDLLVLGRTFAKNTKTPAGLPPDAARPNLRFAGNSRAPEGTAAAAFSRLALQTPDSATWPDEPDLLRSWRRTVPPVAPAAAPPAPAAPFSAVAPGSARESARDSASANPAPVGRSWVSPTTSPTVRRRRWWWRKRGRDPRQGELALATVRVVRNDLFADDLEFIPRPSPQARGLTLGVERAVPSGGWRGWLAHWANLLGLRRERRS